MSNQMLAKVGVFGLIVVNLGAYYVFWPGNGWNSLREMTQSAPTAPSLEKSENPGKPVQVTSTATAAQPTQQGKPATLQPPALTMPPSDPKPPVEEMPVAKKTQPKLDKEPFAISLPPIPEPENPTPGKPELSIGSDSGIVVAKAEDPTIEQLKRLKNSFPKEKSAVNPSELPPVAKPENLNLKPVPVENPGVKPAAATAADSPWSLQMEIAGGQKVLTARLKKSFEFRIICDHVEMKTTDNAVLAIGHVTVMGPGVKGSCNRLVLGLASDTLVLDGKAELHIQQGNVVEVAGQTAELRGEQLTLR
jgi:hypothetical protein